MRSSCQRLSLVILLALLSSCSALARGLYSGWCQQGNQTVQTPGNPNSTTMVQRSYSRCTVTVLITGTLSTPATIYSDNMGTVRTNPFAAATNGYWFFYADNGAYDVRITGSGISSPVTFGAQSVFDPFSTGLMQSDASPAYNTLQQACTDAASRGVALVLNRNWNIQSNTNCTGTLQALPNSMVQPRANQTITLAGPFSAGNYKVFDTSLGGPGSIAFAPPVGSVSTAWFGASMSTSSCPNGDTLSAAWAAAQASLPSVGSTPSVPNVYQGEVLIGGNTGIGTNGYCISSPLSLIPRVTMRGAANATTQITTVANYAPSSQKFMINTVQAEPVCNTNFSTVIEHLILGANSNPGNQFTGGISWCPSLGSHLRDLIINTANVAISWGGPPTTPPGQGNSDGTTSDSITCNLFMVAAPYPQCIVFINGGTDINTTIIDNIKVKGVGPQNGLSPAIIAPAIDPGYGSTTVIIRGVQCETIQWCAVIPNASTGIDITGLSAGGGITASSCPTLSSFPRAVMAATQAQSWHVSGYNQCFQYGVVFGNAPNNVIGLNVGFAFTVIDPANHIQSVITPGINGSSLMTAWNDSGGTTTWGAAVYRDMGAIVPCSIYITTNCAATPGASSISDLTPYGFDCNPERCISYNPSTGFSQTTYYVPVNANVVGNHFTSNSPATLTTVSGAGCALGIVRDAAGSINTSGPSTCHITFSPNAGYSGAVPVVAGTAGTIGLGAFTNAGFDVSATNAGTINYVVLNAQ